MTSSGVKAETVSPDPATTTKVLASPGLDGWNGERFEACITGGRKDIRG